MSAIGAILGRVASSVEADALASVRAVRFRSQLTPDVDYDPNAPSAPAESGGGLGAAFLAFMKPQVTIETAQGSYVYAPYGAPEGTYFWYAVGGAAVLVFGGAVAFAVLARKL